MKGYNISKDYNLLWELINKGYRVPGAFYNDWCCIMHNGEDAFIDFLKIADKETFVSVCREKDLQFIPPINTKNLVSYIKITDWYRYHENWGYVECVSCGAFIGCGFPLPDEQIHCDCGEKMVFIKPETE